MKIEFIQLSEIPKVEIIALLNHPLVRRHMPLAKECFDDEDYEKFIADKQRLWAEHGYGPWAFVINDKFIGWGGLQYEEGDADLALVLHPNYWGIGKMICEKIIKKAFEEMRFESITALLPLSRKRVNGLAKFGFKPDGELVIQGSLFIRYRLHSSQYNKDRA